MERNRRTAKAYARKHQLTVDGSEDDYLDGTTLGLNSFENPDRDARTNHIMQYIGQGIRVKINHEGDIHVKRLSRASVFVHKLKPTEAATKPMGTKNHQLKSSLSNSDVYALNGEANNSEFYGVAGLRKPTTGKQQQQQQRGFESSAKQRKTERWENFTLLENNNKLNETKRHQGQNGNKLLASTSSSTSTGVSSGSIGEQQNSAKVTSHQSICCKHSDKLELDKMAKVFDMKQFKSQLELESRKLYPDRVKLRNMCIAVVSFVLDDEKFLNLPSWIIIINIVALDMLRTEIGLLEPRDVFANSLSNQTKSKRALLYSSHNHLEFDTDGYELADEDSPLESCEQQQEAAAFRKSKISSSSSCSLIKKSDQFNKKQQLAASKRAFANAAALGAYNGDYYRSTAANGENYFKSRQKLLNLGQANIQQSSSSSGFDSHCSSQNDSSAASSRSNIAANNNSNDREEPGHVATQSNPLNGAKVASKEAKTQSRLSKSCVELSPPVLPPLPPPKGNRGKRPPKLPHGVSCSSTGTQNEANISWPIPIPAPPTSATGPSGKANLILVSPTGLSPSHSMEKLDGTNQDQQVDSASRSPEMQIPKFSSIKYIDENGHCKVLLDQQQKPAKKLPAGIPSHAQLAPPATQKHILRYLMSATTSDLETTRSHTNLMHSSSSNNNAKTRPPIKSGNKYLHLNRPLPVLPIQTGADCHCQQQTGAMGAAGLFAQQQCSQQPLRPTRGPPPHIFAPLMARRIPDESLYYRGLQARVINPRSQLQQQQRQSAAMAMKQQQQQQLHSLINHSTSTDNSGKKQQQPQEEFQNSRGNLFSSLQKKSRAFYSLWQISSS